MARGKSSGAAPPQNQFIIVTRPLGKLDAESQKQIRSHVMRGKNRKQRNPHNSDALGSWVNRRQHAHYNPQMVACPAVPRLIGNDITHLQFADDIKPYMAELAFKCLCPRSSRVPTLHPH